MFSPEKILFESLTIEEQQELRFQEHKIDLKLYEEYNGKGFVVYFPGKRKFLTAKVMAILISRYRIGGWEVELHASPLWPICLNFRVLNPNLPLHDIEGIRERPTAEQLQQAFVIRD
jgi:hypothetical protein